MSLIHSEDSMAQDEVFRQTHLTLPMVVVGILLGSLVCVSNMYFGLQIGSVSTMSASTALMGFTIFKAMSRWLNTRFTPTENVVVQAMGSSIASMPIAASLWSVIPAIEYLGDAQEGGPRHFSILELTVWSLGVCFFGTVFSAPFRSYFIVKQKLLFPSPYAVGLLIGTLHNDKETTRMAAKDRKYPHQTERCTRTVYESINGNNAVESTENEQPTNEEIEPQEEYDWLSKVMIILKFSAGTTLYLLLSSCLPVLNRLPIFGKTAATEWLWFLTLSPALLSFGMILDLPVACSMFVGAVIGWGILSPIVKYNGWAPGPTGSMENGIRGWLVWITIGLLLGDALVRVIHSAARAMIAYMQREARPEQDQSDTQPGDDSSTQPLLGSPPEYATNTRSPTPTNQTSQYVSNRTLVACFLISLLICIIFTSLLFRHEIPFYAIVLAIIITLPICLIVIQSAGETDFVPSNNLSNACQFLFGLVVPRASATGLVTMALGAITEAGLWQSAVLMGDLKTAYLVQASPRVMFKGQLLGSVVGTVVGSCVYRFFTLVYNVPSQTFPMPMAYLWMNTARLVSGGSLPDGAATFTIVATALAAFFRLQSLIFETKGWRVWIPSVVAMSVALLVPPSVTLSKLLGAILRLILLRRGVTEVDLMSAAIGCILTEGTLGFIPLLLVGSK